MTAQRAARAGRSCFCLVAAAWMLLAEPHAQQSPDRLPEWLAAVAAHEPHHPGLVALKVAMWPGPELEAVILEAKQYARSLQKTQRDEANDLLLRGAAFHADIARLIPDDIVRRSPNQRSLVVVKDGREQGTRFISLHWGLGRSLLDAVAPEPAALPGVRVWYEETSIDLLRLRSLAEAAVHLPQARRIFPADPVLLFASGVLHERFSSAALQAAVASVTASNRGTASVSGARAELGRAERFFRETLAVDPNHLEARLRYGHVLGELGRPAPAAEALRAVIQAGATGERLYLAELFLARQEEALGNGAQARAHYVRAAALYPMAQSPRLALSQLSRRTGDRAGAQRELRILAALPDDETQREDPWWEYYDVR